MKRLHEEEPDIDDETEPSWPFWKQWLIPFCFLFVCSFVCLFMFYSIFYFECVNIVKNPRSKKKHSTGCSCTYTFFLS